MNEHTTWKFCNYAEWNKADETPPKTNKVHAVWFYSYKTVENANWSTMTKSRSVVPWGGVCKEGERDEGRGIAKGWKDTFRYLDWVDSFRGVYLKTYQIVLFKYCSCVFINSKKLLKIVLWCCIVLNYLRMLCIYTISSNHSMNFW